MPEDTQFLAKKYLLTADNFYRIAQNLTHFGIDQIRLTGGEPFLRSDIREIIEKISQLPLKKLGITTNGIELNKHLDYLPHTNLKFINISLDSLNENTFHFLSKNNSLHKVLDNIIKAKELGFIVKINCVILRNYNFQELEDLINFSCQHQIEIRFLELMKIGNANKYFDTEFVSADEMIQKISSLGYSMKNKSMPNDSTSFNYIINNENHSTQIGFIASESKPFCGGCSRLRLSADGTLRPCMMVAEGPNLVNLNFSEYSNVLKHLIEKKPTNRIEKIEQTMNQIGG